MLFATALVLSSSGVYAQDTGIPHAQPREAGTYYKLFILEFKPGKTDDALEVLNRTLIPAWREAGIKVHVFEQLLQTRDVFLLIDLKDGPNSLAYSVPEQDARAWAALVRIAGSAQAANHAVDELISMVQRQTETLVFERR